MDLTTKWAIAIYGWFGYNLLAWFIQKQKADRKKQKFNYLQYADTHVDNWVVTLFFAAPVVYFGPEIHATVIHMIDVITPWDIKMPWSDVFYAGPGPFVELLYFFASKAWPAIQKRVLRRIDSDESPDKNKSTSESDQDQVS